MEQKGKAGGGQRNSIAVSRLEDKHYCNGANGAVAQLHTHQKTLITYADFKRFIDVIPCKFERYIQILYSGNSVVEQSS